MQIVEFGAPAKVEGVTEEEMLCWLEGVGKVSGYISRVTPTIFMLRRSSEMFQHFGTIEEILPLLLEMSLGQRHSREHLGNISYLPPSSRKITPTVSAAAIDDFGDL